MKVSIDTKAKTMTIVMEMCKPTPSASGKTDVVASTRGNVKTDVLVDGRPVTIGVNAYIPAVRKP